MQLEKFKAKTGAHKKYNSKYFSINIMNAGSITLYATITISDDGSHFNIGEGDHSCITGSWKISKITDVYTMAHKTFGEVMHIVIEP